MTKLHFSYQKTQMAPLIFSWLLQLMNGYFFSGSSGFIYTRSNRQALNLAWQHQTMTPTPPCLTVYMIFRYIYKQVWRTQKAIQVLEIILKLYVESMRGKAVTCAWTGYDLYGCCRFSDCPDPWRVIDGSEEAQVCLAVPWKLTKSGMYDCCACGQYIMKYS